MYEILSSSVKQIKGSNYLDRLLGSNVLDVHILCEDEKWLVHFSQDEISIGSSIDEVPGKVTIKGNRESLRLLFNGDDFLLSMQKRGEIEVSGSLQDLLLLESIIYLSKSRK